jgi:hypothetical protein
MITSKTSKSIVLVLVALLAVPVAVAMVKPSAHRTPKPRFSIHGKARRLLYPAGAPVQIAVKLHNPSRVPIVVTAVRVSLRARGLRRGCTFRITQAKIPGRGVKVRPRRTVTLPAQHAKAPTIRMAGSGNQDRCKGLKLQFRYTGRAHS